jgi:cytochrome bd-type quinol oxidase subunit 2
LSILKLLLLLGLGLQVPEFARQLLLATVLQGVPAQRMRVSGPYPALLTVALLVACTLGGCTLALVLASDPLQEAALHSQALAHMLGLAACSSAGQLLPVHTLAAALALPA